MRSFREFPVEVRSAPPDAHPSRQLSSAPEDRVLGPVMRHSMDVHLRGLPADCDARWVGGQAAQDAPRRLARTVQDYFGLVVGRRPDLTMTAARVYERAEKRSSG
jgi:hypothetical protein